MHKTGRNYALRFTQNGKAVFIVGIGLGDETIPDKTKVVRNYSTNPVEFITHLAFAFTYFSLDFSRF